MFHAIGSRLGLHENIVMKVKEYQAEPPDIFFFSTDGGWKIIRLVKSPYPLKDFSHVLSQVRLSRMFPQL